MTDKPTSIGVAEAKRHFADVLGAVHYRGERFILERNGTPMAAVVPLSDLQSVAPDAPTTGFLALVGAFDDAPEFVAAVAQAAGARSSQRSRAAPKLER
ncbi:MAG: type II toxin-antitoxin system Phd/YefM family antitoxin [Candidatus Dormibacteraeota bacterium]|nr:type II toxin-antitoxin system Phd/YefM family antitoxin [Candidatus Dormibacteraeota bacterium]